MVIAASLSGVLAGAGLAALILGGFIFAVARLVLLSCEDTSAPGRLERLPVRARLALRSFLVAWGLSCAGVVVGGVGVIVFVIETLGSGG